MLVLGIDLNDKGSQIAYMTENDSAPNAISPVIGSEEVVVPTALCKNEEGGWYFGKEAVSYSKESGRRLWDNLLDRALSEEFTVVDGEEIRTSALLLKYVKRLLAMSSLIGSWQSADYIVFTLPELSPAMVKVLREVFTGLDYPAAQIGIISNSESFYEYIIHQKEQLWLHDVLALDYTGEGVTARMFSVDKRTKPAVCTITDEKDSELSITQDEQLMRFCKWLIEGRVVSCVYMIGDYLDERDIFHTLKYLCMKRQVFQGRSIYTKGACYAAWDRAHKSDSKADGPGELKYLFLGSDKLRSNVGLKIHCGHDEIYKSLVDAGVNWYDVKVETELYLGREKEIRLLLTPISGKNEHNAIVRLADFPSRPEHTTRVKLSVTMASENELVIKVEDKGFGQIFPSSGKVITEKIMVSV